MACNLNCDVKTKELLKITDSQSRIQCKGASRQRLSNGDCPEDEREDYQNCSVLNYVRELLCRVIRTHTSSSHSWLMVAFVVLGLVSSVLRQEIGQNDQFCVEKDVKP